MKNLVNNRINILDGIRGFLLINMIAYHLIYDLVYIFNVDISWYGGFWANVWQKFICCSFILISGFVSQLPIMADNEMSDISPIRKKKLLRGLTVFACGLILTAVTYFFMPSEKIIFGILSFIGLSMIIVALLRDSLNKIRAKLGFLLSIFVFFLLYNIPAGYINFGNPPIRLPSAIYETKFLYWLGFPNASFSSSDFFPMIPWLFLYLAGFYLSRIVIDNKFGEQYWAQNIPVLNKIGQHSLPIYMLHQPIIYAILLLII
ncbi:MAG: heparan-alpha-glucosaminide N-acetyltransferase [Anaerovoracaceae bacterium]